MIMEFEKRQGIIIYLYSLKQIRQLRKYGNVHYISRKMKYVVLYTAMDDVEGLLVQLNRLNFVKQALPSYKPFLNTTYEKRKMDKEKELEIEKHYGM